MAALRSILFREQSFAAVLTAIAIAFEDGDLDFVLAIFAVDWFSRIIVLVFVVGQFSSLRDYGVGLGDTDAGPSGGGGITSNL